MHFYSYRIKFFDESYASKTGQGITFGKNYAEATQNVMNYYTINEDNIEWVKLSFLLEYTTLPLSEEILKGVEGYIEY
jgi:hypothetical protein